MWSQIQNESAIEVELKNYAYFFKIRIQNLPVSVENDGIVFKGIVSLKCDSLTNAVTKCWEQCCVTCSSRLSPSRLISTVSARINTCRQFESACGKVIFPKTSSPSLNKLLKVVIVATMQFFVLISNTRIDRTEVTSSTLLETIEAIDGLKIHNKTLKIFCFGKKLYSSASFNKNGLLI